MFEFEWPWLFLALPLPLLVWRLAKPATKSTGAALRVPFYRQLSSLSENTSHQEIRPSYRMLLPWIIWFLLVLAASRPVWLGDPIELQGSGRDLMMAVDLSGSMEINDMELGGYQVDRLVATKAVMTEFIERRRGDRLGLILFGSQAYLQTPLTFDRQTVKTLMDESFIGMAGNKTAIGDALGLAVKHLRKRPDDSRVLILLTDGANTAGEISPLQAASIAAEEKIKIYSIGLGAEEMIQPGFFGSSIGARKSQPFCRSGRKNPDRNGPVSPVGRYFRARDTEELAEIYALLDKLEPVLVEEETFRPSKALFFWPLVLALLLSLIPALLKLQLPTRTSGSNKNGRTEP